MKQLFVLTTLLCFFLLIFTNISCTYNKEEELYGLACDTSNVRYSVEIKNILNASCLGCHSGSASAGAGIKLDAYENIKFYVDQNVFLESMTRETNYMPKGAPRLSSCKIDQIKSWINKGAPNN
jgi:mono/diheme cytochrome c family protein